MDGNLQKQMVRGECPSARHLSDSRKMGIMTTPDNRTAALEDVRKSTARLEETQEQASRAVSEAGKDRARAIRRAVELTSAKEVAAELGISVQRVYGIVREAAPE